MRIVDVDGAIERFVNSTVSNVRVWHVSVEMEMNRVSETDK